MNILKVSSVCFKPDEHYIINKLGKHFTLKNISFELQKGEILGIAGESGSGKTTLAKLIAGIYTPSSGTITINKSTEWEKTKTSPVQILFQNNGEVLNPFRNIFDIINEAVYIRNKDKTDHKEEAAAILESVGFDKTLWNKKGFQLSGGEQQRAALARTIACRPELLILDEPFSAQDPESRNSLSALFKSINSNLGISMICISHNLQIIKELCDKIMIMYKGEIVEMGQCLEIFEQPKHSYTKYLLKAENYDLSYEELKYIPG